MNCAHGGESGRCVRCLDAAVEYLAKSASAALPKCQHPALRFNLGGFHVVCETCGRVWQATDQAHHMTPDFLLMSGSLSALDRRVDPMRPTPPSPTTVPGAVTPRQGPRRPVSKKRAK